MNKITTIFILLFCSLKAQEGLVVRSDAPPPDHYADRLFKGFSGKYTMEDAKGEDIGYIYYLIDILNNKKFAHQSGLVFKRIVGSSLRQEKNLTPEDKTRIIEKLSDHMTVGWSDKIAVMNMQEFYRIKDVRVKEHLKIYLNNADPYVKSVAVDLVSSLEKELASISPDPSTVTPTPLAPTSKPSAKPTPTSPSESPAPTRHNLLYLGFIAAAVLAGLLWLMKSVRSR